MTNKNIEQWQLNRYKFYKKPGIIPFIENYFDVKDGVRCVAAHPREYPKKGRVQYEYQDNMQRMYTFYPELLIRYNCIHSFMHIFDPIVLEWTDENDAIELYRTAESDGKASAGINAILEVDSPYDSIGEKARRLDIFNFIPELNNRISKIDKWLNEYGENYNIQFSGNGVYIILEGVYPKIDNDGDIKTYKENFINMVERMKETELGDKTKIHIDNNKAPWNDYMKIPFTFHERFHRISIPLQKGEIIKEDLIYYSDPNNIMNNPDIVSKIIKDANWQKLW